MAVSSWQSRSCEHYARLQATTSPPAQFEGIVLAINLLKCIFSYLRELKMVLKSSLGCTSLARMDMHRNHIPEICFTYHVLEKSPASQWNQVRTHRILSPWPICGIKTFCFAGHARGHGEELKGEQSSARVVVFVYCATRKARCRCCACPRNPMSYDQVTGSRLS